MANRLLWLTMLLLLVGSLADASDQRQVVDSPAGSKAFVDLGAYYADNKQVPPYAPALTDLAGQDAGKRAAAGGYLLALFKQSFADETNGRAPVKRSPFFGGGGTTSDARTFRKELAEAFGKEARTPEALDCVGWLLDHEKLADNQARGMDVLRSISAPAATALLKTLLAQPHPDQAVDVAAIQIVADHHLIELAPEVKKLCAHYRAAVREAAVAAMTALQGPVTLPGYDPAEAFTPWLSHQIDLVASLVAYPIPASASWTHFSGVQEDGLPPEFDGWLIPAGAGHAAYAIDEFGRRFELPAAGVATKAAILADAAKRLMEVRKQGGEGLTALSRRGGLTWQFEPKFISLPEALVGAWCYQRGDKATAAKMLFPLIEGMRDDRWMLWIAADLIGPEYLDVMLHAFTYDRDYAAAIAIARHLATEPFSEYVWHDRAAAFADQLGRRGDDFVAFTLPTPAQWAAQKKGMTRADQITFLAKHLRLLNCFQMGQPGAVDFQAGQTAGSRTKGGTTEVINPCVELEALKLQPADLPSLIPFLTDEDYLVAYGYWRDFHPQRYLYTVGWMVANTIDGTAKTRLTRYSEFIGLDAEGQKRRLDEMLAWCAKNADKTRDQLPDELHLPPPGGPRIDAP